MNTEGSIAIWALTPNGCALAKKLAGEFPHADLFFSESQNDPACGYTFKKLSHGVAEYFYKYQGHIFIMATGIVVRVIAPHIVHKTKDPAVVVVDDAGRFSISLLSGHLGGANSLAKVVSEKTGSIAVITTATDINHVPSIDLIAQKNSLEIENPEAIKRINMAFLEKRKRILDDPYRLLTGQIPESLLAEDDKGNTPHICVDDRIKTSAGNTLFLRPKILSVGIGCNRGTDVSEIRALLFQVFTASGLSPLSIRRIASIDVKKDEAGILKLAEELNIPTVFFDKDTLNQVTTISHVSQYAEKYTGAKNVCEAAAILSAGSGELIVEKKKTKNVTLAIAREKMPSIS